jgi:hypothetical protein
MYQVFEETTGRIVSVCRTTEQADNVVQAYTETAIWARTGKSYDYRPLAVLPVVYA